MSFHHTQYNSFYYNSICHVCKESSQGLKRCAACKTVAYCSKDHQKQNWPFHKTLCRAIVKSDDRLKHIVVSNFQDFKKYNISRSMLWIIELSRELYNFESQMWMFPRTCALCFSKNVTVDCSRCLNASYCSDIHKNIHEVQHLKFCGALKLCMDIDLYNFYHKWRPDDISVCDIKSEVTILPSNLQDLMNMYDKVGMPKENNLDEMIQFIIKADLVAPAATILFGMEKSGLLTNRSFNKTNLTVHIVGAELMEMCWLWKLIIELPFHWIHNLKTLNFHVIGPELNHEGVCEKFPSQLCDSCKAKHPISKISFHWKMYHEIVSTLDKPDIVVALNSGIHEVGENCWRKSIDCLTMYPDMPLILTAYTENEILSDIDRVRSRSNRRIKVVLEGQKNPFSNMKPLRDWETENSPIFYSNGYIAILKGE